MVEKVFNPSSTEKRKRFGRCRTFFCAPLLFLLGRELLNTVSRFEPGSPAMGELPYFNMRGSQSAISGKRKINTKPSNCIPIKGHTEPYTCPI